MDEIDEFDVTTLIPHQIYNFTLKQPRGRIKHFIGMVDQITQQEDSQGKEFINIRIDPIIDASNDKFKSVPHPNHYTLSSSLIENAQLRDDNTIDLLNQKFPDLDINFSEEKDPDQFRMDVHDEEKEPDKFLMSIANSAKKMRLTHPGFIENKRDITYKNRVISRKTQIDKARKKNIGGKGKSRKRVKRRKTRRR
jgi:hypothetical protein